VRNSGSISLRFAYTRRRARSLFLFFCGLVEVDGGLFDNEQQKIITTRSCANKAGGGEKRDGTEKWMVGGVGGLFLGCYYFLSKIRGRHRGVKNEGRNKKGTTTPTTTTTPTPTNAPKEKEHYSKRRPKGRGRRKFFFHAPGPARWVLVSSLSPFCDECFCSRSLVDTNGERKKRGDYLFLAILYHSPR